MLRRACNCVSTSLAPPCRHALPFKTTRASFASISDRSLTGSTTTKWLPTASPTASVWSDWLRRSRTASSSDEKQSQSGSPARKAQELNLVEEFLAKLSDTGYRQQLLKDRPRMERIIDAAIERDVPFVVHVLAQDLGTTSGDLSQRRVSEVFATREAQQSVQHTDAPAGLAQLLLCDVEDVSRVPFRQVVADHLRQDRPIDRHELHLLLDSTLFALQSSELYEEAVSLLSQIATRFSLTNNLSSQSDPITALRQTANFALQYDLFDCAARATSALVSIQRTPSLDDMKVLARTVFIGSEQLAGALLPEQRTPVIGRLEQLLLNDLTRWSRTFSTGVQEYIVRPMLDHVDNILVVHNELELRTKVFARWHAELKWLPGRAALDLLSYVAGGSSSDETRVPIRPHLAAVLAGEAYRQWVKRAPSQIANWTSHECCEWLDALTSSPAASPLSIDTARRCYFMFRQWSDEGRFKESFVPRGRTVLSLIRRSTPPDSNASKVAQRILDDYIAAVVRQYPETNAEEKVKLSHWQLSIIAQAYTLLGDSNSTVQVYERLLSQRMLPNKSDIKLFLASAAERDLVVLEKLLKMLQPLAIMLDACVLRGIIDGCARRQKSLGDLKADLNRVGQIVQSLQAVDVSTLRQYRRDVRTMIRKREYFDTIAIEKPVELFMSISNLMDPQSVVRPTRQRLIRFLESAKQKRNWRVAASLCGFALDNQLYDGAAIETTLDIIHHAGSRRPELREEMRATIQDLLERILDNADDLLYRRKTVALASSLMETYDMPELRIQLEQWKGRQ